MEHLKRLIPTLQNEIFERGANHGGLLLSFFTGLQNEIASAKAGDICIQRQTRDKGWKNPRVCDRHLGG